MNFKAIILVICCAFTPIAAAHILFGHNSTFSFAINWLILCRFLWIIGAIFSISTVILGGLAKIRLMGKQHLFYFLTIGYLLAAIFLLTDMPNAESVAAKFQRDIPLGAEKVQVIAYLKKHNVSYQQPTSNVVIATIPDTLINVGESYIYVQFFFANGTKLTEIQIEDYQPDTNKSGQPITINNSSSP